jgi:hypothetical protein
MNTTLPQGATGLHWYFQWTYGATNYVGHASYLATKVGAGGGTPPAVSNGGVAYAVGTRGTTYSDTAATTGSMTTGAMGNVQIRVPLDKVGAPPVGATLTGVSVDTWAGQGGSVQGTGGSALHQIDHGPGGPGSTATGTNFVIGTDCNPPPPGIGEVPFAPLLPVVAAGLLFAIERRRRAASSVA